MADSFGIPIGWPQAENIHSSKDYLVQNTSGCVGMFELNGEIPNHSFSKKVQQAQQ